MNRAITRPSSRRLAGRALVVFAIGLALSGCGRRGELEAPPGSTPPPAESSVIGQTQTNTIDAVTPATRSNVVPPRKPFILDSIL
ncbi:MAG: lipoprotein [Beijerinckiaceae bacterium]|nr:lipoprotein [Beijerinckiaceae bacterium]